MHPGDVLTSAARLVAAAFLLCSCAVRGIPPVSLDDDRARTAEDGTRYLRTPDERFEGLPGYAFAPHYVLVQPSGLRMHYVDEGPRDGPVVLLIHGNPAWSYLVRDLIPPLVAEGYRVIAPDLIGFGRSDKPTARTAHTYAQHIAWMRSFVRALDLTDIRLYAHDWGGFIAMRVVPLEAERFRAVALSNTGLPMGQPLPRSFHRWRDSLSQKIPSYAWVARLAVPTRMTRAERLAYEAPYPDEAYKAGPRQLPKAMPIHPDEPDAIENTRVFEAHWRHWDKPFVILNGGAAGEAFSERDQQLLDAIPGAMGQPHAILDGSGHYLQEDVPDALAEHLVRFFRSTDGSDEAPARTD